MKFLLKNIVAVIVLFIFTPEQGAACENESDCLKKYRESVIERDSPPDFIAAGDALRKGCTQAQTGESCRILSYLLHRNVVPGSAAERSKFDLQGCQAGDRIACKFLGNDILNYDTWVQGRDEHYMTARPLIEDSCYKGNDYACRLLIRFVSRDDADRYSKQCDAGKRIFCALAAGFGFYPNSDEAYAKSTEDTFHRLCVEGEGVACIFLGDFISSGHGSSFTETQVLHMLRACELGVGYGCDVSRDILLARNPKASREERLALLRTSCAAENPLACLQIARLEQGDDDAARIRFAELLKEDCLAGGSRSCEEAASVFEALKFKLGLRERYKDMDQYIQNYFDMAEALRGKR